VTSITEGLDIRRKVGESEVRGEREPKATERIAGDEPVFYCSFDMPGTLRHELQIHVFSDGSVLLGVVDWTEGALVLEKNLAEMEDWDGPYLVRGRPSTESDTDAP
jgi:hypothetical protein